MEDWIHSEVKYLPGVGEVRSTALARELGIRTLEDLLWHFPFRYVDRSKVYRIGEIREAAALTYVQFRARITGFSYAGEGRKQRFVAYVSDGTGVAELLWFRAIKWIERRLEQGREYLVFGRPSFYRGELSIVHPEIETMDRVMSDKRLCTMQGIYPMTEKLNTLFGTKGLNPLMAKAWELVEAQIADPVPAALRQRYGLATLREALRDVHFPQSAEQIQRGTYRLKFDELLGVQLGIQSRRTFRMQRNDGFVFPKVGGLFNAFYSGHLPFALTGAQKRVVREIRQDTVSGFQMNRLLQGDVGSGKTMVALLTMLLAVDNGFQACMMAPTEILARQHFATLTRLLAGLPVRVGVLTGASKARERKASLEGIASGGIHILVGTHALIEERVQFENLGFVVIDEQHRFGVEQRAQMWTKNKRPPHILVMTATPIPRTLAMTLYGDLDVSVIDELPPGRQPIRTMHFMEGARMKVNGFLRREIAAGRQVYIVYPLIEESETLDYSNLFEGFEAVIRDFPAPDYAVSVCHGRMKAADKEESMRQFKEHEADILVATSVIEVGVDVPNATVMVIESAERFGLSQLHQLRGRVGRGGGQSWCILMSGEKLSREARARLKAMCETTDGFKLAELDMKLRGAGDINGTQQSGMAFDLKIANPVMDVELLHTTRDAAADVLAADPELSRPENRGLAELRRRYSGRERSDFSMIS